ncbi:hypothetical protein VQ643_16220, partial [Pseudomonas sp. F1_0610]|uniref:hypothetical protein n=1 Tax=Pseudomonas sp. F1_0610 TaxID=3114284 RepID=UPI0039C31303
DFKYSRLSESEEFVISDLGSLIFKSDYGNIAKFNLILAGGALVGVAIEMENGEVLYALCCHFFLRIDDNLDYYIEIFKREDTEVELIQCG